MNKSSYFIKDKALFGSYPTDSDIKYYEDIGVKYFIDLTCINEIKPYTHNSMYIKYCIKDMDVPKDCSKFSAFIIFVTNIIKNLNEGEKLFASCKGGHGRVGVLVSCILCMYHNIDPLDSLQLTSQYHSNRIDMKQKWREIGSPQTQKQKNFVIKLLTPICFSRNIKIGDKVGFSIYSAHPITITCGDDEITFETSELAYNFLIDREEGEVSNDKKIELMEYVVLKKLNTHNVFLSNLISTNLRPIIFCSSKDTFWGISKSGEGRNELGKILVRIRNTYILRNIESILSK